MSNNSIFKTVFAYVRKHGTLVNTPKSCWGEYRWEFMVNGVTVVAHLQDEGYTSALSVHRLFMVAQTCDDALKFYEGNSAGVLTIFRMLGLDK